MFPAEMRNNHVLFDSYFTSFIFVQHHCMIRATLDRPHYPVIVSHLLSPSRRLCETERILPRPPDAHVVEWVVDSHVVAVDVLYPLLPHQLTSPLLPLPQPGAPGAGRPVGFL